MMPNYLTTAAVFILSTASLAVAAPQEVSESSGSAQRSSIANALPRALRNPQTFNEFAEAIRAALKKVPTVPHHAPRHSALSASDGTDPCAAKNGCQECNNMANCQWCGPVLKNSSMDLSNLMVFFGRCQAKTTACDAAAFLGGLTPYAQFIAPLIGWEVDVSSVAKSDPRCQPVDVPPELKIRTCAECFAYGTTANIKTTWCDARATAAFVKAPPFGYCLREELGFLCNKDMYPTVNVNIKGFEVTLKFSTSLASSSAQCGTQVTPPTPPVNESCAANLDCTTCNKVVGCTYCGGLIKKYGSTNINYPILGACRAGGADVCKSVTFGTLSQQISSTLFEVKEMTGAQCTDVQWPAETSKTCAECLQADNLGWCDYAQARTGSSSGVCMAKGLKFLCTGDIPSIFKATFYTKAEGCPSGPSPIVGSTTTTGWATIGPADATTAPHKSAATMRTFPAGAAAVLGVLFIAAAI